MTTSTTVAMLNSHQVQEEPPLKRLDPQRRRSLPKITGRKLRTPRKFVVTDVSDEELDALNSNASSSMIMLNVEGQQRGPDHGNENVHHGLEDVSASSAMVRKGKTQVKGRFTITDLSPESPEEPSEHDELAASAGPTPSQVLEVSRCSSRKMAGRKPFQSAGDARPSVGITNSSFSHEQQQQQLEMPLFASFECSAALSPSSRSERTSMPAYSMNKQVSNCINSQPQTVFENQLKYLENETFAMKSALEKMVVTNAQWIETLTSTGLVQSRLCEASAAESQRYRKVEQAYMELQAKHDAVCQKSERMELKNAMLEIRLHQQISRSTMLRSQLDKLTRYTEKLICESSEPTLHDYNSDLNSVFGEQSETHSPTADDTSGGEYGFSDTVLKSRRQRWRNLDEECMSNTSTEGDSFRKTSSPVPYEQDHDSSRYYSDMDLMTADLLSTNGHGGFTALDDQLNIQLHQSLRSKKEDADASVSVNGSLDSMTVCPSVTNFVPNDDDECDVPDQTACSVPAPAPNRLHTDLLKHSNSVASLNYSTVSSTSSLAAYGLHLATMAQSKSGCLTSMAATSLFGPHPKPCPNACTYESRDDDTVYNVLSPENLRFHDCQSLLQAAEARSSQTLPRRRRGFPFTTKKHSVSLPETKEASERIQMAGSLFDRFTVRRRKPIV